MKLTHFERIFRLDEQIWGSDEESDEDGEENDDDMNEESDAKGANMFLLSFVFVKSTYTVNTERF